MGKTRGVHETTPEIRNRMVGMYEAGLGLKEIAAALNCSERTVKRWLNRFNKEGTVETRDRCGRKRATTKEQDEAIVRLASETPITAAKAVLPALGLRCSVDTVRERLHKAGIHNWIPSKKQIQKISIENDGEADIQQAVWRPTGTQLGKKKVVKEDTKTKSNKSQQKKKIVSKKNESQKDSDENVSLSNIDDQAQAQTNFSSVLQDIQPATEIQSLSLTHPLPVSLLSSQADVTANSVHYSHSFNVIQQPQPIYPQHPGFSMSQNWPLDLVQGNHCFSQPQQSLLYQEPPPLHIPFHSQLPSHNDLQIMQETHQAQSSINLSNDLVHQQIDPVVESHEELSNFSPEDLNDSQDMIINVCSDVCSNSTSSENENIENSSIQDEIDVNNIDDTAKKKKSGRLRKKKKGKIKGTLETSVEIRNRMIGMSEAGLSTVSIALAVNRSERTVKRWLDRWRREGNVQTKERKGRKRITTKEEDDAIIDMATKQPLTSAKLVAPALGLKCSVDTVRERLHKAGIHSWKIGKKRGEGNTVHNVHLWQPSGNRPSKIRKSGEKKKKPQVEKSISGSIECSKQKNQEGEIDNVLSRIETSSMTAPAIIPEDIRDISMQYQDPPHVPAVMQAPHDLHLQVPPVCSQVPMQPQLIQPLGPMMQQRPDCRLAFSSFVPSLHTQPTSNMAYPSCMMGTTNHMSHMEQADPLTYEPYIWSF